MPVRRKAWRTRQRRRLQAGAWRVPLSYAAGALAAAWIVPRLEVYLLPGFASTINESAALAVYSSIASGMIALTGIVFSLTFVMVQFSATAYSPRLVLWLFRDPLISHALGIFMATFLYALAALSWIGRSTPRVPFISVLMVLLLLLASVCVFVGLIQRVALLQINRLLAFTGDQGRKVIGAIYPPFDPSDPVVDTRDLKAATPRQILFHRGRPLAVQTIHVEELVSLAQAAGAVIDVVAAVGDTLVESTPILHVIGSPQPLDEQLLMDAIELGEERTFDQDPKYAIRILVDIAIKALSPAINDPTTAVQALDQIGDLLLRLAHRRLEVGVFSDGTGQVRVLIPFPSWEDFLRLGFDEIQWYGATSVQVRRKMNALISDLIRAVPTVRRAALEQWQERLEGSIDRYFVDPADKREASAEDRQGLGVTRRRPAA